MVLPGMVPVIVGAVGTATAAGNAGAIAETAERLQTLATQVGLSVSGLLIPQERTREGLLVQSTSGLWTEIVQVLGRDWSEAFRLTPEQWEEIVAGAFSKHGFEEVTLTPRSGDRGRDVIAIKRGVGCIKIIGSVKAYQPQHKVGYDDVRALLGVMSGERDVSKGIISTTSSFPSKILEDPYIQPFVPTRLELMDGPALQRWLTGLARKG